MIMSNDIYTAKAVGQSAAVLGYWLIAASLLHAIVHPVAMAVVTAAAAQYVASQAADAMDRMKEEMGKRP